MCGYRQVEILRVGPARGHGQILIFESPDTVILPNYPPAFPSVQRL